MEKGQISRPPIGRRAFLERSGLVALGAAGVAAAPAALRARGAAERLSIGVIGLGRGIGHIRACVALEDVDVTHVCDVDRQRLERGRAEVAKGQEAPCRAIGDLRRILDDRSVDAVSIATCNHWHAPATILACRAGKHVYIEKPGSHNPREAELMVAAARKHERVVQMGNQRRSWPGIIEGIEKVRGGAIGEVRYARAWYTNTRPSIGRGQRTAVPEHLDYDLWQGPAPERPLKDNLIHYNWHWHWHWGNGELGNNGVHSLDLLRWGLGVDAPRRVTYGGGRYRWADDQETPDSGTAVFDFGRCGASWEQSSCHGRKPEDHPIAIFYGDGGRLALQGTGWVIHDPAGTEVARGTGAGGDEVHFRDFVDAIQTGSRPHSEIEDAQRSTLLCHLGNIAYRLGRTIDFDPAASKVVAAPEAAPFWGREYRDGWEPEV